MSEFKVSWEINIYADTPLEAAKYVNDIFMDNIMREDSLAQQFYVQNEETKEIFSIDLQEEDEDAVLPVTNYTSFIVQK